MKVINVEHPPKKYWLGRKREKNFRPVPIDAQAWLDQYPGTTVAVIYRRPDGVTFPVATSTVGEFEWLPKPDATAVAGEGKLEIHLMRGDEMLGISATVKVTVDESLADYDDSEIPETPSWVDEVVSDVTEQADRAEEAVEHYPKIVNGIWYVWSVQAEDFVSTGIEAQGEDGVSPTVTVTAIEGGHRVTITDASGDHTFDVMDGEGGTSADAVLYTEQTLNDSQKAQARKNIGSKPPIYLAWDDTVDPGICEKSATEIGLLVDDGYDVHILVQAFRGYDLRFRSVFAQDGAPVAEFGVVFIKEDGSLENLTVTVDEQKHVELVRTHVSSAELEISQEIDDWADGKALDAGAAKDALNQVLDDVGDELNSKANASDLARVATTGSYNDLSDKPTIPSLTGYATETWVEGKGYQTAAQVQTAISGVRQLPTVTASDNGKSLVVENGAWGKGYQAARTPRVAMTASDTTPTLDPNKLYVFPTMASLTPTLVTPTDNTIVNEYHFVFDSGSTATVLTLPASVLQPDGFTVEANMHYEVSILEGAMTAQGWAVTA